jgi:glycosyltransferase involved in cell wall biosynthesis
MGLGAKSAVVVSPDPGSDAGGTERMCHQVATALRRLGFGVELVGPGGPGPRVVAEHGGTMLWQAGTVRRAALARDPDLVVTVGHLGWPGHRGPARVHVHTGNLVRLARHQAGAWHWKARWGLAGGVAEAMAGRGATVVAVSRQAAEDAARLYRARRVTVLTLGVDTGLFRPRDRDTARRRLGLAPDVRYGLFVGRGEAGKGPDIALAACRRAGWELLAAGSRPVPGSRSLGVLPAEELAWAYAAADALVLPTAYEGWSYAVGEALAVGVPVVTTPVGWARDLGRAVPSYRPFLVPREVAAVTAALGRVASGDAAAAIAPARALVLADHTVAAFEGRWRDLLTTVGVLRPEPVAVTR